MRVVPEHLRKSSVGAVFGRLTIIGLPFYARTGRESVSYAVCQCECGNVICTRLNSLRSGMTKACGCWQKDAARKSAKERHPGHYRNCATCGDRFRYYPSNENQYCSRKCVPIGQLVKTHGMSKTRIYQIWSDMKARCSNPNSVAWEYYGGRGIAVCVEWADSFEEFYRWSKVSGYQSKLELDRIDNNGSYCPENCRWATRTQQMHNTRKRRSAVTSQFKGVSLIRSTGRWRSQIIKNGENHHLGVFDTEIEAAEAYNVAAVELFGAFAHLNNLECKEAASS